MPYSQAQYRSAQIYPYGSQNALLMERNIGRFLEREHKRYQPDDECTVVSDEGPMWRATDALMITHYDQDATFFATFLDKDFQAYSMAYYGEMPEEVRESQISLEQAQANKFKLICDRAGVAPNKRILNIGCGFGALEIYLLSTFPGVELVSLTPSCVQFEAIRKSLTDTTNALSHGNMKLIHSGFEELSIDSIGEESFDLVISIGVLEHACNLKALFKKIAQLLKPGGTSFHHLITSKTSIPRFLDSKKSLIGEYFPGGRIWPYAVLQSQTQYLSLKKDWFINGINYWRTLDIWHERFWENLEKLNPQLSLEQIRYWNDYFILCKACFTPGDGSCFGNGHFLYRKPD